MAPSRKPTYSSPCPAVRTVGFLLRFGVDACFAELASAARAYAVVMYRCFVSCGRIADKSFRVSCDAVFRSKSESKKAVNASNRLEIIVIFASQNSWIRGGKGTATCHYGKNDDQYVETRFNRRHRTGKRIAICSCPCGHVPSATPRASASSPLPIRGSGPAGPQSSGRSGNDRRRKCGL